MSRSLKMPATDPSACSTITAPIRLAASSAAISGTVASGATEITGRLRSFSNARNRHLTRLPREFVASRHAGLSGNAATPGLSDPGAFAPMRLR